jgi:hypothetical protein
VRASTFDVSGATVTTPMASPSSERLTRVLLRRECKP